MKLRKMNLLLTAFITLGFLAGCANFTGIRNPLYDGEEVVPNDTAIETYQESGEIIGAEKDYYFRYPASEDIYQESLAYSAAEPVLLEPGEYIIGEDIPAGRVTLLSNESVFSRENSVVHVGNMVIYDEVDAIYFENLFHSDYGTLTAQVDFIPGHRLEIVGTNAEITVFYDESIPDDPYVLMDPPELLVNLDRLVIQQPLIVAPDGNNVQITAGIYEVGEHFPAGGYLITDVQAVHATELFLFRAGEAPRVFELLPTDQIPDRGRMEPVIDSAQSVQMELLPGDKLYPSLVRSLDLTKIE